MGDRETRSRNKIAGQDADRQDPGTMDQQFKGNEGEVVEINPGGEVQG